MQRETLLRVEANLKQRLEDEVAHQRVRHEAERAAEAAVHQARQAITNPNWPTEVH